MNTGENEQGLRKIIDMTRMISLIVLMLHFYYYCYNAFAEWSLTTTLTSRLLANIFATGLFSSFLKSKLIALAFLLISLLGAKGKKNEKLSYKKVTAYIVTGLLLYFFSFVIFFIKVDTKTTAITDVLFSSIKDQRLIRVGFLEIRN